MSLTSDIATLVARYEALAAIFDGKKAEIDAAVANSIAAIPLLTVRYYVDAVNGNDAKDGQSVANALQTIGKVFQLAGQGRAIEIVLVSDYVMTSILSVPQNSNVHIIANGFDVNANPNVRRKLTFTLLPNEQSTISGEWQLSSFRCGSTGLSSFDFTAIEIVLPAMPATGTLTQHYYNGLVSQNAIHAPTMFAMQVRSSTITTPANPAGWLMGLHTSRSAVLIINNVVSDSALMPGHWISGFASGAQVSASTRLLSNLATL